MSKLIPLTKGRSAIVDDADVARLSQWRWRCVEDDKGGYAATDMWVNGKRTVVMMHRFILNAPAHMQVDHIDRNGLNNQQSNLRLATREENARNRGPKHWPHKASKYKGVYRCGNKWSARIYLGTKTKTRNGFSNEVDAARAYDNLARAYFGSFAYLNFPEE